MHSNKLARAHDNTLYVLAKGGPEEKKIGLKAQIAKPQKSLSFRAAGSKRLQGMLSTINQDEDFVDKYNKLTARQKTWRDRVDPITRNPYVTSTIQSTQAGDLVKEVAVSSQAEAQAALSSIRNPEVSVNEMLS